MMGLLWNRSGIVERYADDLPADGAKAYFYEGGTTTPLVVFADSGEAQAHPHPVVADSRGRWPDVFIPYTTSYDVQVTSRFNVQLTFSVEIPNPDPIDLTVTIGAEEKVSTGMIHAELINNVKSGYVRLNGLTMGNAASAATERANADTEALFTYLWNNLGNTIAAVSSGRGASAAADYAANKTVVLPDMRGHTLVGLDTMGNSEAGTFTGIAFTLGGNATPGSTIGANSINLSTAQMAAHTHTGTTASNGAHTHTGTTATDGAHSHTTGADLSADFNNNVVLGGTASDSTVSISSTGSTHSHAFTTGSSGAHTHTFTTDSTGSGAAVNVMQRSRLVTWFIKL